MGGKIYGSQYNYEKNMSQKSALLLGVVFSKEQNPSRGQGFRDRVRCEALEREGDGYVVHTLDNKHDISLAKAGKASKLTNLIS